MNSCTCPTTSTAATEAAHSTQRPRFHTREDENGVQIQIALPGVRKEDLKLTLHEANLNIEAERADPIPETWKTHGSTDQARRYALNVRLTQKLDGTRTTATLDSGVLTLLVPIREESKPRQILVS